MKRLTFILFLLFHLNAVYSLGASAFAVGKDGEVVTRGEALTWYLAVPAAILIGASLLGSAGVIGSQSVFVSDYAEREGGPSLRTNVSEQCQAAMIDLHGQEAWDAAVATQAQIDSGDGAQTQEERTLTDAQIEEARLAMIANAAPIGTGTLIFAIIFALMALATLKLR